VRLQEGASVDTELQHRDGRLIPVSLNIFYRAAKENEPGLFITFINDISERKRGERMLREAKEVAESATRAKSAFSPT
jgi:PAS domain S-box-containing protein